MFYEPKKIVVLCGEKKMDCAACLKNSGSIFVD
jgi:hypothetical protein